MRRSGLVFLALASSELLLCACASVPRTPFTKADQMAAVPTGVRNIRFWADAPESVVQNAAIIRSASCSMLRAKLQNGNARNRST